MLVTRLFTKSFSDPYSTVEWEIRNASISDGEGATVFKQNNIEVPKSFSPLSLNIIASKYFRGKLGSQDREFSVRHLISRVANTIYTWGLQDGYFDSSEDAENFRDELVYLLLHQMMAFNSPVWFNVGAQEHPQCSACFINSVEDSMESIMELAKTEARLFQGGSGTGSNLSSLRSSKEYLSGGGTASGPVSFMRGFDAFAGAIKSGGKTRRAAKMVILNADHPDILSFVRCKADEEKKAWALSEAGYDASFEGEAYQSIFFQHANHAIRVTDEFMQAVLEDRVWKLYAVKNKEVLEEISAKELLFEAACAAHLCGDPGIQYDTTINFWHTCKETAPIRASNPCSEYMFLDDSACNLASLNLLKFVDKQGEFDVVRFKHAVEVTLIAQEILVDNSSYPTGQIAQNSHDYRPLGLGYANLGALLMAQGFAYDSDEARQYAAAITSLMTGHAYMTSAKMAEQKGPFLGFNKNKTVFLDVMHQHRHFADAVKGYAHQELFAACSSVWDEVIQRGSEFGFRNAQTTVLAPTGTIAFMMDCDTTGIEPELALIKVKHLVGGGAFKMVNQTIQGALKKLGYSDREYAEILEFIEREETIEGAPHIKEKDLPVFDCAFRSKKGTRSISSMGHLRMMAAVQPFLSGAISKTVNVPEDITREQIFDLYIQAWRLGLKAVAVYRDHSKRSQPLSVNNEMTQTSISNLGGQTSCAECGSITVPAGSCVVCPNCGSASGCG